MFNRSGFLTVGSCQATTAEMARNVQLIELSSPPDMRRGYVFIEGSSPEEKVGKLASIFKELG
jgi:hypothetical protein